jgi:predicted nucleic acid-binding protein
MHLFWDTSAILALIFDEVHSKRAGQARSVATRSLAWNWLKAEAWSGLARRNAERIDMEKLNSLLNAIEYLNLEPPHVDELCLRNRAWRLRAADAGHLFCFQQASFVLPHLQFVCFDDEMVAVARQEGFRLWQPPEEDATAPALVRESRPSYYRKRKRSANV